MAPGRSTDPSNEPVIVFGVDDDYVGPLLVALTSLATSGGICHDNAGVVVLHRALKPQSQERIARVARALGLDVELRAVNLDSSGFPVTRWISSAAYLRLSVADAVANASRALYLDCDLVVLSDLAPLLAFELDAPFGAVRDMGNPTLSCGPAIPGHEQLGIPGTREYFNSGVMLIDLEAWREADLGRRSAVFLAEHPEHVEFWDQCALNVIADDRWTRLPLEDNCVVLSALMPALIDRYRGGDILPLDDALALEERARILHFAGPFKPWVEGYPECQARTRYRAFQNFLRDVDVNPG
jgi:lipopolysaccharide biosynthesis glycosyltransferase